MPLLSGLGLVPVAGVNSTDNSAGILEGVGQTLGQAAGDAVGAVGAVGGAVGSAVGDVTSAITSATSSLGNQVSSIVNGASTVLSSASAQITSSLSTGTSTSASASSTAPNSSSVSIPSSSSSSSSSSSVSATISATSASNTVLGAGVSLADSNFNTQTVTSTNTNTVAAVVQPTTSVTAATSKSFLENKPLAGVIFAGVGVVVLVLLFIITTWALRRRRNRRDLLDTISFDPSHPGFEEGLGEKDRGNFGNDSLHRSLSNASHGTYNQPPAVHAGFSDRQQPYPFNSAYGAVTFNPNAQRDAALAFQRPPMLATQLPETFGDGRRSPEDLMRGPTLKVAN